MQNNLYNDSFCSIVTLPANVKFENLPICRRDIPPGEWKCREGELKKLFYSNHICESKIDRTCVVKEYKPESAYAEYKQDWLNGYIFKLVNHGTPKSSRGLRVNYKVPYKTVHSEFYSMDVFQFIGTIGGTLGLMIGFSFMGTITSFTDYTLSLMVSKSKNTPHTQTQAE